MYNRRMVTKADLERQLRAAMREGNEVEKRTLRMVLSAWKLAEVERGDELDDAATLSLLQKEAKARREAIEDAEKAGRSDIVTASQAELEYLETFLPRPLSSPELEELARKAIEDSGATDPSQMGLVMKDLMPQLQGRADGKRASEMVRNLLTTN